MGDECMSVHRANSNHLTFRLGVLALFIRLSRAWMVALTHNRVDASNPLRCSASTSLVHHGAMGRSSHRHPHRAIESSEIAFKCYPDVLEADPANVVCASV